MNFNLVSRNNTGIVAMLILVILLSQSKFFNFLVDTPAGRMILLGFVVYIAYVHKMMGLVTVLFIILAFDFNGFNTVQSYNYYEGFDVPDASGNDASNNTVNLKKDIKLKKAKEAKLKASITSDEDKLKDMSQTTTTSSSAVSAREGFCMSDKEINMLRGKQSNAIPVYNREQSADVSPSDKSVFTDSYASF